MRCRKVRQKGGDEMSEEMKKEENEITNPHVDMLDFSMLMNSDNE